MSLATPILVEGTSATNAYSGTSSTGVIIHNVTNSSQSSMRRFDAFDAWQSESRVRTEMYYASVNAGQSMPPVAWVLTHGKMFPPNAILGGTEITGEPLFIIRAWWEGSIVVGKGGRSFGGLIPFHGREIQVDVFEVLIGSPQSVRWMEASGIVNPAMFSKLIEGGHENEGRATFIAQAQYSGGVHPAKAVPGSNGAYLSWGGREHLVNPYRMLVLN
eukprot:jgi/Hompol1/2903/HPOL_006262-RA